MSNGEKGIERDSSSNWKNPNEHPSYFTYSGPHNAHECHMKNQLLVLLNQLDDSNSEGNSTKVAP